nr:integrase, catalytic region, zinc finger, CCHC-type, peptidase aspartic, catalytic [Tanacetum cinerariifolium]
MSTQQDIYAAGFENRPPMLNKENYVPWSSRLLRYAKSRPNGKLIHNFIINGPYVRRMIPKLGDPNREVPVNETFLVQTDDELTEKELKQIEADYQAIQTILLDLPEDIYVAFDSCETAQEICASPRSTIIQSELHAPTNAKSQRHYPTTAMNMALALMAKAFKLNYSTPTNNNQRISSNLHNRQIAQPGMNMGQDKQMQMVRGNGKNQFRQYARQNVGNLNGYNAIQNIRNQYTELPEPIPESHQEPQNDNNVISEVTSMEQSGGTVEKHPTNVEETQASKFVGDFKSLAKEVNESLAKHQALELKIERLLKAVVSQDIMFVVQNNSVGETSNLQTELKRTKERFENYIIKKENEYAKLWINPFKPSREDNHMPTKVKASVRTKPITVSQPPVITKKVVNSDSNGLSSIRVDNTKTRRPQPKSNTKNDRVPSASKSSQSKNKEVEVKEHHRNLLLSKNKNHMSSACNNVKFDSQNVKSKVVCAMHKQCLISINHDQKKQQPKIKKTKKVGFIKRLATPKPSKPIFFLRWSPSGRLFDLKGKVITSRESESQSDCSNSDNACTSNHMEPKITRFPNSTSLLGRLSKFFYGTVRFGNDHVASILGFDDLQWGNILITRVYFVEGLGHNFFLVGQLCLPKFKYHREHLCPSCEQGKSKRASHPPKPIPNSRQRLHLLHMDLCGPVRIASINGKRKPDISFLHVFEVLYYPKNDREDIRKLGTKGLDLTYAPSTITAQKPSEGELNLLFEAMIDDFIGGQPSATQRTVLAAQAQ